MECLSYCLAERIDLQTLERNVKAIDPVRSVRQSQVLMLFHEFKKGLCLFFANGTMVTWGFKRHDLRPFLTLVESALANKLDKPLFDGFSYYFSDKTSFKPHDYFNVDCVTLKNDDSELMLSLSYGFSQSIKLKYYEEKLEQLIHQYAPLTKKLIETGHLKTSRSRIQKIIGEIVMVKTEINLVSDLLYQPKFFWQHPNLEEDYLALQKYMDIQRRTSTLNEKINTLNEIFIMFNSYLETKHEWRLEIIIIVLIAVEIVFNVLNLHF